MLAREIDKKINFDSVSVVMPAYNEGIRICDNILAVDKELSSYLTDYEIICVNDGSTDNTLYEMNVAADSNPNVHIITYNDNAGKGHAVKAGIAAATKAYTVFIDSDLDISADHIKPFLEEMIMQDADIAIGSKMHKDSVIDYPLSRRILSWGYCTFLHMVFRLRLKDTQTGIKVYKTSVIQPISANTITEDFAFDIEMLLRAQNQHAKIIELPITLVFTRGKQNGLNRIKLKNIFHMFTNTLAVKKRITKSIK